MKIGQDGPTVAQLEDFLDALADLPNIEGKAAQDAVLASPSRDRVIERIDRLVAHGEYLNLQTDWLSDARELLART